LEDFRALLITKEHVTLTQVETQKWSDQQFLQLVLDCHPQVAVFDCDGTLWGDDSGSGFMHWSMEQGLISRSSSDWIDNRHRAYQAGKVSELAICGEMVQIYHGLREEELRTSAARYMQEFVPSRYFTEMVSLVDQLRHAGVELWAVSSTNKWVVVEGVRALGIPEERVLAAEVSVVDGVLTSELVDVPTDEGKAASLHRVGLSRPDVVFGNSIHDLAMLKMARCAFPVNPSPGLIEAAGKQGWGYFMPQAADQSRTAVGGE
jgi:phosphoserine phosphatase